VEFLLALHYVLAGWSAYWLARSFALTRAASTFAGISYMFGPFLASQTQQLGLVMASA